MVVYRYQFVGAMVIALLAGSCAISSSTGSLTVSHPSQTDGEDQVEPLSSDEIETAQIERRVHTLTDSTVQVVAVPAEGRYQIEVAVVDTLTPLRDMAEQAGAIAAINAGFFDPQNGLTTSYITLDGSLVADPRHNDRLVNNPDLQPYLASILNRSEFRTYACEDTVRYDITFHNAPIPVDCRLTHAIGAGPQLLTTLTGYEEGFLADNETGEVIRDAIGSRFPNSRSAVGLKSDGTVVFAIAQQLPTDSPSGLSLQAFADFLQSIGVEKALNLDGGSSTGLYFEGELYLGRLDEQGYPVERSIKSILLVK